MSLRMRCHIPPAQRAEKLSEPALDAVGILVTVKRTLVGAAKSGLNNCLMTGASKKRRTRRKKKSEREHFSLKVLRVLAIVNRGDSAGCSRPVGRKMTAGYGTC